MENSMKIIINKLGLRCAKLISSFSLAWLSLAWHSMVWVGWAWLGLVLFGIWVKLNYQVSLLIMDGGGGKLKLRLNPAWAELGKNKVAKVFWKTLYTYVPKM